MTKRQWNHNLVVTFIFRITFAASQGLWQSGTGSNYIYYLEHRRNTLVGLVQGVQGLCTSIGAFPAGYAADRWRRDGVLKICGVCGFVGLALIIAAVLAPQVPVHFIPSLDLKFLLLLLGYTIWGLSQAGNPIVESILADSVPTGGRSAIYTSLFFLGMLSRSIGPIFAAIIFVVDGNVWTVNTLGKVMLAGTTCSIIPTIAMFFFNDARSLGAESEALRENPSQISDSRKTDEEVPLVSKQQLQTTRFWGFSLASIPYILSTSDLIYGLASGCTIKFFPVFFAQEVKMAPVAVNIIMAAQPILIGLCATLAQWLSTYMGRIQVLLLLRILGFMLMAVMGLATPLWKFPVPITIIFLMRTGINNAGYPIQKAILMDYVAKKDRGKWSAVDSITAFGWSGSAFLGGILVDRAGFDICFIFTACVQAIGCCVILPMLGLIPRKEVRHADLSSGASEPLLNGTDAHQDDNEDDDVREQHDGIAELPGTSHNGTVADPLNFVPSGLPQIATGQPRSPRRSIDRSKAENESSDSEFIKLIGSLKSPRQSMDTWPANVRR